MKIIALDDEELALEGLMDAIRACDQTRSCTAFPMPRMCWRSSGIIAAMWPFWMWRWRGSTV